ncbi:S1 family peptidase [Pseudonocardia endophytica]|uniref:Streptogrisin C n=1 Tax=Pseudonocardia endophytica TaxID=401976 RepID=A0A4R1HQG7_PSEEN|nr:S1 family peptidase [Pseudonocardia endophytica]TCK22720.1 streptogrisin C [Pseudonocardia endophytica]
MRIPRSARPRRVALALLAAGLATAAAVTAVPAVADVPGLPDDGGLTEEAATALVPAVRDAAGTALAGIWFAPDTSESPSGSSGDARGRLMVGTWEPVLAPVLSGLGATPVVREGPRRDPEGALRLLTERTADGMPPSIADFGVDEVDQTLVVTVVGHPLLGTLLDGLDPSVLRIRSTPTAPRLQAAIGGGDTITDGTKRCTVGFTATDGRADWLVTAGHCTRGSADWVSGPESVDVGGGARTADNGPDAGAIPVAGGWTAVPTAGGVPVRGSRVAPVGAPVCLFGSTSGRSCGPIARQNVVVNFGGQQQSGLSAANLCAREGDSGGPYVTDDGQAQGVHTGAGGPDGCTAYFTPVGTAMGSLGLTLRTG